MMRRIDGVNGKRRAVFALLMLVMPAVLHASRWIRDPAQPYHSGANLICTDCHFTAEPGVDGPGAAARRLGYRPDPIASCLRCHDDVRGIPDVMLDDINHLGERSGGFFGLPGTINPGGHDLDSDGFGVTCIDCHDPHGNGNPRNLRRPTRPASTPRLGLFVDPSVTGMDRYERSHTAYGTLDTDALREVSVVCNDCHDAFSGDEHTRRSDHYTRHPSYDSTRMGKNRIADGSVTGSSAPSHWEEGRGIGFRDHPRVPFLGVGATDYAAAATIDASRNAVFCLSCHKAHGGPNNDGIVWDSRGPAGQTGCNQCHATGTDNDDTDLALRPGLRSR